MKPDFYQRFKIFLLSGVLALTACSDGTEFVGGLDAPAASTVSGSAIKGVIAGADCIVFAADGVTELFSTVDDATPCTGSDGSYTINIVPAPTGPVIIEIRGRSGATLLCDSPDGCGGGVNFNEPLNFTTGSLRSMVAEAPSGTIRNVNVNPWSEVAVSRALALKGTNTSITAENVSSAARATADVLNNLLGLEGSDDSLDENFINVGVVNLASPSASSTASNREKKQSTLLAIASASLFDLVGTSNTIVDVVSNLATAFKDDGVFDVNSTATNLEDTSLGINLAAIATGIAEIASELDDVLEADDLTTLNTLLGDETLDAVSTTIADIANAKEAVTDADQDDTRPIVTPTETLTADQKALDIAIQLDNALKAFVVAADTSQGTNTAIEDIDELLRFSNDDAIEILENLAEVAIIAAELIADEADADEDLAGDLNCSSDSTTTTCLTSLAAVILPNDSPLVGNATGTFVLTNATHTLVASGIIIDGDEYALTMVGDGNDLDTQTSAVYSITSATVDIDNDDDTSPEVSVGTGSQVSAAVSETGDNPDTESVTIELNDLTLSISGAYAFSGDVSATYFGILDGADLEEALITALDFSGAITNNRTNDSVTASNGDTVTFDLSLAINSGSLVGTNLPQLDEGSGETSSNFYNLTAGSLTIASPVTYTKRSTTTYTSTTTAEATEKFKIELDFTRTTPVPIASYDIVMTLSTSSDIDRLIGTITNGATEDTLTLRNGVPGVQVALTGTNLTSDTGTESFGGSVTVDGTAEGSIGSTGVYSQAVTDGTISFQLSVQD